MLTEAKRNDSVDTDTRTIRHTQLQPPPLPASFPSQHKGLCPRGSNCSNDAWTRLNGIRSSQSRLYSVLFHFARQCSSTRLTACRAGFSNETPGPKRRQQTTVGCTVSAAGKKSAFVVYNAWRTPLLWRCCHLQEPVARFHGNRCPEAHGKA